MLLRPLPLLDHRSDIVFVFQNKILRKQKNQQATKILQQEKGNADKFTAYSNIQSPDLFIAFKTNLRDCFGTENVSVAKEGLLDLHNTEQVVVTSPLTATATFEEVRSYQIFLFFAVMIFSKTIFHFLTNNSIFSVLDYWDFFRRKLTPEQNGAKSVLHTQTQISFYFAILMVIIFQL